MYANSNFEFEMVDNFSPKPDQQTERLILASQEAAKQRDALKCLGHHEHMARQQRNNEIATKTGRRPLEPVITW